MRREICNSMLIHHEISRLGCKLDTIMPNGDSSMMKASLNAIN
ncbi:hypothetical protein MPQ_1634 [Methylovorus sp. MP688]|nr:hypothetical protein MPQ_1634 [Methylovorus sp. MP688]